MGESTLGVERGRGENFYRAFLSGYGSLFFAPYPIAGALFLLGTFAGSSVVGAAILIGLLSSTSMAHLLKRSRHEIESGLFGFNGALTAFALFSLSGSVEQLYLLLVPAAAATAWVSAWLLDSRWCLKLGLPLLSLPSLVVGLPLLYALVQLDYATAHPAAMMPSFLVPQDLFRPGFYESGMKDAVVSLSGEWPVVVLFLAGFLACSRALFCLVLAGLAVGCLVGFAFLGWYGASNFMFVVVTATPVFVALAGTFTGHGVRSYAYGLAGAVLSFPVWFYGGIQFTEMGIPLLTLPFFVTTTSMLLLLRALPLEKLSLLPRPVPLHRVGTPESSKNWSKEQATGIGYWQALQGAGGDATDPVNSKTEVHRARELVRRSKKIVVLTGAGVSTESGIPDYRTGAVAWKQYDTDHFHFERFLASEESRQKYWEMSQDFYLVLRTAEPNAAHEAIVQIERMEKLEAVITQNVDRLHQKAGVSNDRVIEIHGNEQHVTCLKCGYGTGRDEVYRWIVDGVVIPYCPVCQGILKPDSIAFGQPMPEEVSQRALQALEESDLLIVAGTSLQVQPVASLPVIALRKGIPVIVCNDQSTDIDPFATFVFRGSCGSSLSEILMLAS